MKFLKGLSLVLFIVFSVSLQLKSQDILGVLDSIYGEQAVKIQKHIQSELRYTVYDRQNCNQGVVLSTIHFNDEYKVTSIKVKNRLSRKQEKNLEKAFACMNDYLPINGVHLDSLNITIGYNINGGFDMKADLVMNAMQVSGPKRSCPTEKTFSAKVLKNIRKQKWKKAKKDLDYLLRCIPESMYYQNLYRTVNGKLEAEN